MAFYEQDFDLRSLRTPRIESHHTGIDAIADELHEALPFALIKTTRKPVHDEARGDPQSATLFLHYCLPLPLRDFFRPRSSSPSGSKCDSSSSGIITSTPSLRRIFCAAPAISIRSPSFISAC